MSDEAGTSHTLGAPSVYFSDHAKAYKGKQKSHPFQEPELGISRNTNVHNITVCTANDKC